jgi:hypothetical protein
VEGIRKIYNKVGTWIEDKLGKDVSILDVSSGMGYGTADCVSVGLILKMLNLIRAQSVRLIIHLRILLMLILRRSMTTLSVMPY